MPKSPESPLTPESVYEDHKNKAKDLDTTKEETQKHVKEVQRQAKEKIATAQQDYDMSLDKAAQLDTAQMTQEASAQYQAETKEKIVTALQAGDLDRVKQLTAELDQHLNPASYSKKKESPTNPRPEAKELPGLITQLGKDSTQACSWIKSESSAPLEYTPGLGQKLMDSSYRRDLDQLHDPDSVGLDYEKLTPTVWNPNDETDTPEGASMSFKEYLTQHNLRKTKVSVMDYCYEILKPAGYILPGMEFQTKVMSNQTNLSKQLTKAEFNKLATQQNSPANKLSSVLKDNPYYYLPGSAVRLSDDGFWSVPCGRWDVSSWLRYGSWAEDGWSDFGRVLLFRETGTE